MQKGSLMAKTLPTLATGVIVALAIGLGLPAHAEPVTPADCVAQGKVWVHVQHEDSTNGGCASDFATAADATRSAGIALEGSNGFFTTVDGHTTSGNQWYALWTKSSDGDWVLAQQGADVLAPAAGSVVAWSFEPDWNVQAVAPRTDPLASPQPTASAGITAGLPPTGV